MIAMVDELIVWDVEAIRQSEAMNNKVIGFGVMVMAMNTSMVRKVNKTDSGAGKTHYCSV